MAEPTQESARLGRRAAAARTPGLYRALLDTLTPADQAAVLEAMSRHEEDVREADAAGIRPAEPLY